VNWYRVELNSSGRVVDCKQLETCGDDTSPQVFYVWAPDEGRAKLTAYAGYLANQRRLARERKERLKREGRCNQCGGPTDGFARCAMCRDRDHQYKDRYLQRKSGRTVVTPPKSIAMAETKAIRETDLRRAVLLEVKTAWRKSPNAQAFAAWLDGRIKECEAK
jgi:hypothetical protein